MLFSYDPLKMDSDLISIRNESFDWIARFVVDFQASFFKFCIIFFLFCKSLALAPFYVNTIIRTETSLRRAREFKELSITENYCVFVWLVSFHYSLLFQVDEMSTNSWVRETVTTFRTRDSIGFDRLFDLLHYLHDYQIAKKRKATKILEWKSMVHLHRRVSHHQVQSTCHKHSSLIKEIIFLLYLSWSCS